MRLARIGADNIIGYLSVGRDRAFPPELRDLVRSAPRITVGELDSLLAGDAVTLIDIRNPGERERGTIAGAIHIPMAQLRARLREVSTAKPIVVHCASGWRSSVAASLLREHGFENVADLAGGYNAWVRARASRASRHDTVTPASRRSSRPLALPEFSVHNLTTPHPPDTGARTSAGQIDPLRD